MWAAKGLIEVTPGNVTDYAWIRVRVDELAEHYQIVEIAYDRVFATQLVTELVDDGLTMIKPDRERSREKIDGIVSLIMAFGRASVQPAAEQHTSIY